ncbi:MAG: hypothetical protein JNJ45_10245 [Chthonomonas sp.]|nr:hypothetical protein [Chthonomonas sp.]
MNKTVLGVIVAIAVVCTGGTWMMSVGLRSAKKVSDEAFKFVNQEIPPILQSWDAKRVTPIAHPELIRNNPEPQTQKVFNELKAKLGDFKSIGSWRTLGFNPNFQVDGKKTIAANLEGEASFSKGTAYVEVTLIRPGKTWQLAKLFVRDVAGMRTSDK